MKKFFKTLIKIIIVLAVVAGAAFLFYKNFLNEKGLKIVDWDNSYNENNIPLFYEDLSAEKSNTGLTQLDALYKIKDGVKGKTNEKEIVFYGVDLLRSIADYDDIEETDYNQGYLIIKDMGGRKKLSGRDLAILERDILLTEGVEARVGEFRKSNPKFTKNPSYYVVEYWSTEHEKWVMLDFRDRGMLEKDGLPLSAVEIMESKLSELTYIGDMAQDTYKSKLKKYLSSYTIPVDNTLSKEKGNTNLTYFTQKKDMTFQIGDEYTPFTIYTKRRLLFEKEPKSKDYTNDTRAYILMTKKVENVAEGDEFTYVIGAFKNGKILNEYYIQINDDPIQKVSGYIDVTLDEGKTTIEVKEDGQNLDSRIEVQRSK